MKRFSSYLSTAIAVLCLTISLLPASNALAATSTGATSDNSAGLSIEPRKNYQMSPGQTINDKLTVSNLDPTSGLMLSLRMIDFSYLNQSGSPKLYLATNAAQTPWSLKPYTTLPKSVQLGPGESTTINYSITIPKNLGAGSYYSAILYQTGSGTGGNVGLGASGVTLVFVSVAGTAHENMTLEKFGAYESTDNAVTGSYQYISIDNAPQMIAYTLKNEGNVAEEPSGSITLKNMFGKTIGSINKTNGSQSLALIGQDRLFATCIQTKAQEITSLGGTATAPTASTSCVNPKLSPGLYTAKLDLFYGQNGNATHEITGTAHFWYLPWWFIGVVIVILLALTFLIWWGQRKTRNLLKGSTFHAGRGISRKH